MSGNKFDFYISYVQSDLGWAGEIARQLRFTYKVFFPENVNWQNPRDVAMQHQALSDSARTLVLLSPDFLANTETSIWQATWHKDPAGENRKLIPVKIRHCTPTGLLAPIVAIDLTDKSRPAAVEYLIKKLGAVTAERNIPTAPPPFPGRKSM